MNVQSSKRVFRHEQMRLFVTLDVDGAVYVCVHNVYVHVHVHVCTIIVQIQIHH